MLTKQKLLITGLTALLLAGPANAQLSFPAAESGVSYSSVTELNSRPADHLLHYGDNEFQFGRLWLPRNTDDSSKLIVFIHGGCWLNEFDMTHTYPFATALAQAGFAVWSLEYRRTGDPGGGWPGSYDDIKSGIEYVNQLQQFDVDIGSMVIAGHSAGGHLALLAGVDFPDAKAVVGLAAITNIVEYAAGSNSCETATPLFMGSTYEEDAELYNSANPASLSLHANTLLLHGTADNIVDLPQSILPPANTFTVDHGGHFDWVHPGTDSFQLLLKLLLQLL